MAPGLVSRLRALARELAELEPALMSGEDCRALAEELAATTKICAAATARAAARAAACGAHRAAGFRDAEQWLARAGGTTVAEASAALEVAKTIESCPATRQALVSGPLSLTQAHEITRTEVLRPGSESELVALAVSCDLKALRDAARKRRLDAVDVEALHARQREAREVRHWRDDLGMVRISGALPPEVGIGIVNRLDAETARVRRRARRQASTERYESHAADALVAMLGAKGTPRPTRADLVLVCDFAAWCRGRAEAGEVSAIIGGGPVPVSVARELAKGAFVKAVLHDGVRIHTVAHFGRHIPAELRTALALGSPPEFDGIACTEPGCGRRANLEWDHDNPVANGGPTSYANLKARCWLHHAEKTERDRRAGLLGARSEPP